MSNHNNRGSWDPSSFRIGPGDVASKKAAIRTGRRISSVRGKFIAGPVDVNWLSQARKLGVTAVMGWPLPVVPSRAKAVRQLYRF